MTKHACLHCDHIVTLPPLTASQVALCPYCGYKLAQPHTNPSPSVMALGISALIMLICALCFPFLSFSRQGLSHQVSLPETVPILFEQQYAVLAVFFAVLAIVLPLLILVLLMFQHTGVLRRLPRVYAQRLVRFTLAIHPWAMAEIFLVGVLVSMVKVMSLADIGFGWSFWAYTAFVLLYIGCLSRLNKAYLWQQIQCDSQVNTNPACDTSRAIDSGLHHCHSCDLLSRDVRCPRCNAHNHLRKPYSIQYTLAWLVTAMLFCIPANLLPIMYTTTLGNPSGTTIIAGVITLWEMGSYPIAMIIFFASIILPLAKGMVLVWLCYISRQPSVTQKATPTQIYRITELIGKWSMIDVFVVLVLVTLVQLGNLISITPGLGVVCFGAMVVCQMISAHAFDPRLMWDTPESIKGVS
ncbi:MAG: paraquat-inducible protein [Neptuniibacter caesariensis]|uniref:Paraquat-inducible protein n=1 Tax=Neptuniibacter caesariensis TaxID=207954 RepID=A0A2G6JND9_NEPCE|nr:MAG: paraquat-inducible protein [Neptuniibacter caesariensis]